MRGRHETNQCLRSRNCGRRPGSRSHLRGRASQGQRRDRRPWRGGEARAIIGQDHRPAGGGAREACTATDRRHPGPQRPYVGGAGPLARHPRALPPGQAASTRSARGRDGVGPGGHRRDGDREAPVPGSRPTVWPLEALELVALLLQLTLRLPPAQQEAQAALDFSDVPIEEIKFSAGVSDEDARGRPHRTSSQPGLGRLPEVTRLPWVAWARGLARAVHHHAIPRRSGCGAGYPTRRRAGNGRFGGPRESLAPGLASLP